jgi:L-lactate dehydrogenase (cytochrome)
MDIEDRKEDVSNGSGTPATFKHPHAIPHSPCPWGGEASPAYILLLTINFYKFTPTLCTFVCCFIHHILAYLQYLKMAQPNVSAEEVARHNNKDSCWIAVRGKVYDVTGNNFFQTSSFRAQWVHLTQTDFLDEHPGGARVILKCAGRDATADYDAIHPAELIEETLPPSAFKGNVDPSTLEQPKSARPSATAPTDDNASPPLSAMINVRDFEQVAERTLPANAWAYYAAGADDEYSKADAERAYRKVLFRPRILRDVSTIDTRTKILGHDVSLPVYISAVGIAKFAHPQGECTLAAAAGHEGLAQLVATRSSMSIDSIMKARTGGEKQPIFFQLYMHKDAKISEATILKAIKAGVKGIWLTVDSPVTGKRERDERLKDQVDVRSPS